MDHVNPPHEPVYPGMIEALTEQFYRWERRGRGWQLWDYAVDLEPPFRPFVFHYARPGRVVDDGRTPTLLSSLVEGIRSSLLGSSPVTTGSSSQDSPFDEEEPVPEPGYSTADLVEFGISLPPNQSVDKERAEQFLVGLTSVSHPISFEVIGGEDSIRVHLACRAHKSIQVRQTINAYFPEAVLVEQPGYLKWLWNETAKKESAIIDFGLAQEFMRPLKIFKNFEVDPLIGITAALSELHEGELGLFQILFQPVRNPWAESIIRSVTDWEGESFFLNAPEMVSLAKEKASRSLFAVVIRVAAQGSVHGRAWQIAQALGGTLTQFASPMSNELIALENEGYDASDHQEDVLLRQTHRTGMLLNSDELVSLVHLPSASVRSKKLKRTEKKTKAAPDIAFGHKLILGQNIHHGKPSIVTQSPDHRIRHTYVIGASGTGKSSLLLNMIIQDLQNGEGVGVLDPHGDLIDQVLGSIPEQRFSDVVLFDSSDAGFPIGFNILSAHSELEKNLLASDLVAVFRRLSTNWGTQMNSVLANAILAVLESSKGGTLKDLRRFLVDKQYRNEYLKTVHDREVVFYWEKEFPLLIGRPEAPILTRLDTFLRPRLIRNIVCQKENRLNFREMLDSGKIFLCKLSHGGIGEENASLLGSLIVSKIEQTVISRQEVGEGRRRNFYLYVDEFQNFITPSMEAILSGARKYHLGLILAHQELRQIWSKDKDVASSAISNPYTRICFRLGDFDAQKLKDGFSFFGMQDLQNLGIGEAICRIERAEYDFNLAIIRSPAISPQVANERKEAIIAFSRQTYGRKREEVEKEAEEQLISSTFAKPAPQQSVKGEKETQSEGKGVAVGLSPEEVGFLEYISRNPDLFVTRIYETLNLSGYKGDRIKEGLIEKGFIVQSETRQGAGGRLAKVITVTEKGRSHLKERPSPGKGGDQHTQMQMMLKEQAELHGWKAKIEERIPGTLESVDVGLTKGDLRVAVEISDTTKPEQEVQNIRKCVEAGYDYVLSVSTEEKHLWSLKKAARRHFTARERERIRFYVITQVKPFLQSLENSGIVSEPRAVSDKISSQKQLLDIHEAAHLLGIRVNTLYTWVSQKRIPYVKVGRLTKFHRSDLEQWLEQKKVSEHELRHQDDV